MTLSLRPPKWTVDRFPQEYKLRSAIFSIRREACTSFGYEEYLGPIVEYADIYRAKSGEDVGWSELTIITDRAGRELALRPEMTPTVTRMIASQYTQLPKPIRYFSIANFFRNERPQRGRNREFRQLNFDCFGSDSLYADIEVIQLWIEIMLGYGAPKWSFIVYLNDRTMIDKFLQNTVWLNPEQKKEAIRTMDKWDKITPEVFTQTLVDKWLQTNQVQQLIQFLSNDSIESLGGDWAQLAQVYKQLCNLGYEEYIQFKGSLMRWFDYYDGVVFEFFDTHPDNNRAMFGWGRYNGLASIFGVQSFPAVGAAPGDEPAKLFVESRWLVDKLISRFDKTIHYYIPVIDNSLQSHIQIIANQLRKQIQYWSVITSLETKRLGKAIEFANKQGYDYVVICGEQEYQQWIYKIKNLSTGEESEYKLSL